MQKICWCFACSGGYTGQRCEKLATASTIASTAAAATTTAKLLEVLCTGCDQGSGPCQNRTAVNIFKLCQAYETGQSCGAGYQKCADVTTTAATTTALATTTTVEATPSATIKPTTTTAATTTAAPQATIVGFDFMGGTYVSYTQRHAHAHTLTHRYTWRAHVCNPNLVSLFFAALLTTRYLHRDLICFDPSARFILPGTAPRPRSDETLRTPTGTACTLTRAHKQLHFRYVRGGAASPHVQRSISVSGRSGTCACCMAAAS